MNTEHAVPYQASTRSLVRASVAALAAAIAILIVAVLPAEYGIDPTGVGKAIGLTALSPGAEDAADTTVSSAVAPAATARPIAVPQQTRETIIRETPYRMDQRVLTLAPHSGAEIKAQMQEGDQFVFSWTATGPIKMDMHGERSLTSEDAVTYWKEKGLTRARGSLTAPFPGIHGWYWRNQGEASVTVTLHTAGFYARLIQPNAG